MTGMSDADKRAKEWQAELARRLPGLAPKPRKTPLEPLPPKSHGRRPKGRRKYITENPRKDVVLRRALAEMGDKDLIACLEHHANDPRATKLLKLLADPVHGGKSLPLLVQMADYTRPEIIEAFRAYKADVMRVKLAQALPGLADDLAEDVRSVREVCLGCNGAGEIIDPSDESTPAQVCKECRGRGFHRTVGPTEARKMLLEATGLVKRGGGFTIPINLGDVGKVDSFDSLIAKAHDITNAPVVTTAVEEDEA